jgi:hypothetical protein
MDFLLAIAKYFEPKVRLRIFSRSVLLESGGPKLQFFFPNKIF